MRGIKSEYERYGIAKANGANEELLAGIEYKTYKIAISIIVGLIKHVLMAPTNLLPSRDKVDIIDKYHRSQEYNDAINYIGAIADEQGNERGNELRQILLIFNSEYDQIINYAGTILLSHTWQFANEISFPKQRVRDVIVDRVIKDWRDMLFRQTGRGLAINVKLPKRLQLISAEIQADNHNKQLFNEANDILDKLLKSGKISKDDYMNIICSFSQM